MDLRLPLSPRKIESLVFFLLLLGITLSLSLHLIGIQVFAQNPWATDYLKFYESVQLLRQGQDIYTPIPVSRYEGQGDLSHFLQESLHPNLNPPFFTLLLFPLGLLPFDVSFWLWSLINLGLGMMSLWFLTRSFFPHAGRNGHLLVLLLGLTYFPTWGNMLLGQVSFLLFGIILGAWYAARAQRWWLAGLLLGIGASLKLYLGLFGLMFLLQRKWRLVIWAAIGGIVAQLFALWSTGIETYRTYVEQLGTITWYSSSWNGSVFGFFTRILGGSDGPALIQLPGAESGLGLSVSYLIFGLILALWIWIVWRQTWADDYIFGLTIVIMLLISPLGWIYYYVLLWFPFLLLWRDRRGLPQPLGRGWVFMAWLLTTLPHLLTPSSQITPREAYFFSAAYFLALILLAWLLLASTAGDLRRRDSRAG